MTLPASGAISFNAINVELGVAGTTTASLGQASYRTLAGVPSGAISLSNFYGKSNQFAFTISSNQTNANLRTLAVNAGWNQSSKVIATISGGVYISSSGTGTPGLTVNGSFPGGVELVNNGFIVGMGGAGGSGSARNSNDTDVAGSAGSGGGLALSVSSAISITNNGTVAGGGGGGGGGQGGYATVGYNGKDTIRGFVGGGGGGGGRSSAAANSAGGAGRAGGSGNVPTYTGNGSNGGAGTSAGAGGGGAGGYVSGGQGYPLTAGAGGAGGGWGSSGATGGGMTFSATPVGYGPGPYGGGGGGGAVSGNGNITWVATGTRLGSIA